MCAESKATDSRTALRLNRLKRACNSLDLVGSDLQFPLQNFESGSADAQKCDLYFSHEMLSSNGSSTDHSGHTASSSKTSLNSTEGYDTMLNRKYCSSLSGSQTNINARQLRLTERKSSVPETSLENKGHSHSRKPKKDVRRAEIVAAVTRRLYTTKKRPDIKLEQEEPVKEEKFEDEDDEPEELKLCSRARAKLQEISKRAMNVQKKVKNMDTQTDIMPTLRVKEVGVNTCSSGITRTADICLHTDDSTSVTLHKEAAVNTDLESCVSLQNRLKCVRCACFRKSQRTILHKEASVSTASADHDGQSDTLSVSEESVNYTDDFTPDKSRFRDYCGCACHPVAQSSNSRSLCKVILCPLHTDATNSRETCWDFSKHVGTQANNLSCDIVKCYPTRHAESSVQTSWMQDSGTNTQYSSFSTTVGVQTTTDVAVNTYVSAVDTSLIEVKDSTTQSVAKITQTHEAIETISDTLGSFLTPRSKSPLTFYALRNTTGTVTDTAQWTTSLCQKYYLNVLSRSRKEIAHVQQLKSPNLRQRWQDKQPIVNHSRNSTQDDNFSDDSLESQQSIISCNVEVIEPEINEEPELLKAKRTQSRKGFCLRRSNAQILEIPNNRNATILSQKADKSNHVCCRTLRPCLQSHNCHCSTEAPSSRNCCLCAKNSDNQIFLRNRGEPSQQHSPTCRAKECYCDCRKANLTTLHPKSNSRTKSHADTPAFDVTKEDANDTEYTENQKALNICTDFESELENQEVVSPDFSISHHSGKRHCGELLDSLQAGEKENEVPTQLVQHFECAEHRLCSRSLHSTPHLESCISSQHVSWHSTVPDENSTSSNKNKNSSMNKNPVQTSGRNVCGRQGFTNPASEMTDPVSEFNTTVRNNISQDSINKEMSRCTDMPRMHVPVNAQEEVELQDDVNHQDEVFEGQAVRSSFCTSNSRTEPTNGNTSATKRKSDTILADDVSECRSSANSIHFRTRQSAQSQTKTSSPSLQSSGKSQGEGNQNFGECSYPDIIAQNNNFRTKMHIVEETIITKAAEPFSNPEIPESRVEFTIMSDSINVCIMGMSKQAQSSDTMRRNNFNSVKSESGTQTNCTYENKQVCLGKQTHISSQETKQRDAVSESGVNYSRYSVQKENTRYETSTSPSISMEQKIFKDEQESFKKGQEVFYSQNCSPFSTSGNEINEGNFPSQQTKAECASDVKNDVLAPNESRDFNKKVPNFNSEQKGNSSLQLSNHVPTELTSDQQKSTGHESVKIAESKGNSHCAGNEQSAKEAVSAINPNVPRKRVSRKKPRSHLPPLHGNRLSSGAASSLTTQGWGNAGAVGTWFTLSAFVRKASSLLRNLAEVTQMMENTKKLMTKEPFESNTSYVVGASPLFTSKENGTATQSATTFENLIPATARPAETRNFTLVNKQLPVTKCNKRPQLSDLPNVGSDCNKNVNSEKSYPNNISSAKKLYVGTTDTQSYTADMCRLPINTSHEAQLHHLSYSDYCAYGESFTTGIEDLDIVENCSQATGNALRSKRHRDGSSGCSSNIHGNAYLPSSLNTEPLVTRPLNSQNNKNTTSHYRLKSPDQRQTNRTITEGKQEFLHHPENITYGHDEDPVYTRHNNIRSQFPWGHLVNGTRAENCSLDTKTPVSLKSFFTTHKKETENSWDTNMSVDEVSVVFPSHTKTKHEVENSSSSLPIFSDNDHCCFGNIFTTIMNYHQQKKHQCPLPYQSSSDRDRPYTSTGVNVPACRGNFIRHAPKTIAFRDSGKLISNNIVIDAPRPNAIYTGCSPRAYKQYLLSVRRKIATDSGFHLKPSADITHTDNVDKY